MAARTTRHSRVRRRRRRPTGIWLTTVVLVHLFVVVIHGRAHAGAHVPLSRPASLFVYVVILAGPLAGLALTQLNVGLGGRIIAVTMAGALVFGVANHFIAAGPDHVGHVEAQWQLAFGLTAVALALTEATGIWLGVAMARTEGRRS